MLFIRIFSFSQFIFTVEFIWKRVLIIQGIQIKCWSKSCCSLLSPAIKSKPDCPVEITVQYLVKCGYTVSLINKTPNFAPFLSDLLLSIIHFLKQNTNLHVFHTSAWTHLQYFYFPWITCSATGIMMRVFWIKLQQLEFDLHLVNKLKKHIV